MKLITTVVAVIGVTVAAHRGACTLARAWWEGRLVDPTPTRYP